MLTKVELFKEDMKFSAGHFTVFSAHSRERLHGHNYQLYASILALVHENGWAFDYRVYKSKLRELCQSLDEYFLIAGCSPYLKIREKSPYIYVDFDEESIPFLLKDVLVLPVRNITVEELSSWLLQQFVGGLSVTEQEGIVEVEIKVSSGPGQTASSVWKHSKGEKHG